MKTTTSCTPNRTDLEAARQAALRALEQLCRARGISIPAELRRAARTGAAASRG